MNKNSFSLPSRQELFQKYGPFIILVLLSVILGVLSPYFLSLSNFKTIAIQTAVIGLLTLAETLVIITGGIDLSPGSFLALLAVIGGQLLVSGIPIFLTFIIMLLLATLLGSLNGFIITQMKVPPFIATLGTLGMARGLALIITEGIPVSRLPDIIYWFGRGNILLIPVPVIILFAVSGILHYMLNNTLLGRYAYSIGSNEEATQLSGINVTKYKFLIYIIAGILASIAAIIMMGRLGSAQPTAGQGYELNAIAGSVIGGASLAGGVGTVSGSLIGAFIMTILNNGFTLLGISSFWQQFALGAVVVIAVYIDISQR